ncbi:hypothetical protein [Bradyrhizobium liaoningense]|uniref:hypothetical protein n=1 Tax=Bradyrhizobium liaoningense TaxID=43992 RepID=UPI0024E094D0|nr:hypothetical protein [Bradyrhizobium liaoningense]
MQSAKLLEPPSPKLLPTRPQFIRGRYALHLIIAQDRKASSLIHANRSHRFGSVFGLWLACIDVKKPFAKADHSIFRQRSAPPNMVAAVSQLLLKRKRVFYRTGYARGWPRRRVTPGPSSVIGTAWLT